MTAKKAECNKRDWKSCPLNGNCFINSVRYKETVCLNDDNESLHSNKRIKSDERIAE